MVAFILPFGRGFDSHHLHCERWLLMAVQGQTSNSLHLEVGAGEHSYGGEHGEGDSEHGGEHNQEEEDEHN